MALRAVATCLGLAYCEDAQETDRLDVYLKIIVFGNDVGDLSGPNSEVMLHAVNPFQGSVKAATEEALKTYLISMNVPFGQSQQDTVEVVL